MNHLSPLRLHYIVCCGDIRSDCATTATPRNSLSRLDWLCAVHDASLARIVSTTAGSR